MFSLIIIRLLTVLLLVTNGSANVEKTIFVAPSKQSIAGGRPTLGALRLQTLSPRVPAIRTHLEAVFTSKEHPRGLESWFLLDELLEGKRYEVRLCWMSTVRLLALYESWLCIKG